MREKDVPIYLGECDFRARGDDLEPPPDKAIKCKRDILLLHTVCFSYTSLELVFAVCVTNPAILEGKVPAHTT